MCRSLGNISQLLCARCMAYILQSINSFCFQVRWTVFKMYESKRAKHRVFVAAGESRELCWRPLWTADRPRYRGPLLPSEGKCLQGVSQAYCHTQFEVLIILRGVGSICLPWLRSEDSLWSWYLFLRVLGVSDSRTHLCFLAFCSDVCYYSFKNCSGAADLRPRLLFGHRRLLFHPCTEWKALPFGKWF